MRKSVARRLVGVVALAVAFAFVGGAAVAQAANPTHINNAYRKLRRAHYVLEHSCHRLGGHRKAALDQVQMAINQVKLAAQAKHHALPAVSESGNLRVKQGQAHPYIHDALRECRGAKNELVAAKHDFGGHRAKALNHVNAAISALESAKGEPRCK